jgi:hypothetical protein
MDEDRVVGQTIYVTGQEPMYVLAPETFAEATSLIGSATTVGARNQPGSKNTSKPANPPQPKTPVDVGASGTPKNVGSGNQRTESGEGLVQVTLAEDRLPEFLSVAESAGANGEAQAVIDNGTATITLPESVGERVATAMPDITVEAFDTAAD